MVCLEDRNSSKALGMIRLGWAKERREPLTVLCLGAHSDDIEIGCGATILQLGRRSAKPKFCWVVFSATGPRKIEAQMAAQRFMEGCESDVILKEFRDGYLPYDGTKVKDFFEELKTLVKPDVIFTHWHGDAHQDHRQVSELTWNTFRNHLILEYEIPKFDGDLGRPNTFVALEEWAFREKVDNLSTIFASQKSKPWFHSETFLGLMRLRGMESNSPSGYAEAFYIRKMVIETLAQE
jgi:LmbE family N-acetylglucosaminyl deacetylase